MKIAVFGDIHGNKYVFNEFVKEIMREKVEFIFFTGDLIGYYYNQNYIAEKLLAIENLISVLGNHDKNYLDSLNNPKKLSDLSNKYGKSYIKLKYKGHLKKYLECQKERRDIRVNNRNIILVHGDIEDYLNGRIYPTMVHELQELDDIDYVFFGHTHYKVNIKTGNTRWVNPGSLGQPRDGEEPSYAIVDLDKDIVEYRTINYKKNDLVNEIRRNDPENKYLEKILFRRMNIEE